MGLVKKTCMNCLYCDTETYSFPSGICKRYPPAVILLKGGIDYFFPKVNTYEGWCGEFKIKAEQ